MIEARALECVRGRRRLFADLSFVLQPGEWLEVRGPNGSGKTSLLRMLCGLLLPARGAIHWHGSPIGGQREAYLASVAYVGHQAAVKGALTALENLRLTAALAGYTLDDARVGAALGRAGLQGHGDRPARELSQGQRRRLALARLIACPASLWLLDEVLTSLDDAAARDVSSLIDEHLAAGGMAVIATHQPLAAQARAPRRIDLAA